MPLQTHALSVLALGERDNHPPSALQPRLADGVHLRWAFRRQRGFPWHGYYVFRRAHRRQHPICARPIPNNPGQPLGERITTAIGIFHGATGALTSAGSAAGIGIDLARGPVREPARRSARGSAHPYAVSLVLLPDRVASRVEIELGFLEEGSVQAIARHDEVEVARAAVSGEPDDIATLVLEADAITDVVVSSGPAILVRACVWSVADNVALGWKPLDDLTYPLCLPVAHPDYPCPSRPADPSAARAAALGRIRYGEPAQGAAAFDDIHATLKHLVEGGPPPGGLPMHERAYRVEPTSRTRSTPDAQTQRPLDIALLAALHPAIAQLLGLYWVDRTAEPGQSYDYLVLADFDGTLGGSASSALTWLAGSPSFAEIDAWVVSNVRVEPAAPLAPPAGARAFLLPGIQIAAPVPRGHGRDAAAGEVLAEVPAEAIDAAGNVGLGWQLGSDPPGGLVPDAAVMYHLWRSDLGSDPPAAEPDLDTYTAITAGRPILVSSPGVPGLAIDRPSHWPPDRVLAIDRALAEGWYSYRLSGIDLFGRHSVPGPPAPWFQWAPPPDPRPWYYEEPAGTRAIHPWAIDVLDKTPPPAPAGIHAAALDPADPTRVRDAAYRAWYDSLGENERATVIGLRVRWSWPRSHQRQAPDTREFRIYVHPGSAPPRDPHEPTSWQERRYVVGYDEHVIGETPDERRYEVLLPAAGDARRSGVALTPSLARPIVYASVAVSAADGREHTGDAARWSGTEWGDRSGNEGPVGTPATVFRVLRQSPPAPALPPIDADRVFASRADYHARSFFTYRWVPAPGLLVHVFRALDDALWRVDWARRPRPPLSADDLHRFPPDSEPGWDEVRRGAVVAELEVLDALASTPGGEALARVRYRALSDHALRVLAGLPGNERAFVQRTTAPLDPAELDPDDPSVLRWRDRVGPDTPATYVPDPGLRAYVDALDGRATNRYLYRAAHVDRAHNRGPLGLASPPVWLPDVVPPRVPALVAIAGGDRRVTLSWRSGREPDLVEYRIYRTTDARAAADIRRMDRVAARAAAPDIAARPVVEVWVDDTPAPRVDHHYRVVAVDRAGNASPPTPVVTARAYDDSRPDPPAWNAAAVDDATGQASLSWTSPDPALRCLVQRRPADFLAWESVSGWLPRGVYQYTDADRSAGRTFTYRLRVMDESGALNRDHRELTA